MTCKRVNGRITSYRNRRSLRRRNRKQWKKLCREAGRAGVVPLLLLLDKRAAARDKEAARKRRRDAARASAARVKVQMDYEIGRRVYEY